MVLSHSIDLQSLSKLKYLFQSPYLLPENPCPEADQKRQGGGYASGKPRMAFQHLNFLEKTVLFFFFNWPPAPIFSP